MESVREKMHQVAEYRKRILKFLVATLIFGFLLMLVAVCTKSWFIRDFRSGMLERSDGSILLSIYVGIWSICRVELRNSTDETFAKCDICKAPDRFQAAYLPNDSVFLNYRKSSSAFSVISLVLIAVGIVFALYTFKEPRYMFKRLAAAIHFIAGISTLVCVETLSTSMSPDHLPENYPHDTVLRHGYSYVIAWLAAIFCFMSGFGFLICSRKRKGEKAETDEIAEANEPISLSRA